MQARTVDVELSRRAERRSGLVADYRRWRVKRSPLVIVESVSTYGLGRAFLLVVTSDCGERLLSRHRRRSGAVRAAGRWMRTAGR